MYFLEKFGFSAAPLVLGLILGPIAEANFIQGSLIANAQDGLWLYFFTGALNMFLVALVIASIGYSFWSNMLRANRRSGPRGGDMTASRLQHLISSSAILAVALIVAWLSFTQEPARRSCFPG